LYRYMHEFYASLWPTAVSSAFGACLGPLVFL